MQQLISYLEEIFQQQEEVGFSCASNVVSEGEVIFERYIGYANREYQQPIHAQTVFPISSVSKQFTAMVIMQLVEEGRLAYDDVVSEIFHDFPQYGVGIRVEDLFIKSRG